MPKPKKVKIRKVWLINPKTRVKESKKIYKRSREKQRFKKEVNKCLKESSS